MAKPLKILFSVIGALLLLIIAAAIALPLLFDPNDYRDKVAVAVQKQTGRTFAVGDIRLSVIPWLRVQLADVRLGNAEGFGAEPMLTIKQAEVGVKLMPLLREKRIEASTIKLGGVDLKLTVNAEGLNNWQDLVKSDDTAAEAKQPPLSERMKTIDIAGVVLSNVTLHFDDQQKKQQISLQELNLKTGRLHANDPLPVEGRFKVLLPTQQATAEIDFASELAFDAATGDVRLNKPKLQLKAEREGASALRAGTELDAAKLEYLAASQQLRVDALNIALSSFSTGPATKPVLSGNGKLTGEVQYDLAKGIAKINALQADIDASQSGASPMTVRIALQTPTLEFSQEPQTLNTDLLNVRIENLVIGSADKPTLTAKGKLSTRISAALAEQSYGLKALDAELQLAGSALPEGKPQNLKLKADVAANLKQDQASISGLQVSSMGLNASGKQWSVTGLTSDKPQIAGDIAIAEFAPRPLLTSLAISLPAMADAKTLQALSFSSQFSASAKSVALTALKARLDDTSLSGELAVRDFASQAIRFALNADKLDADRYLPPPEKSSTAAAKPGPASDLNATELPIDALAKLNAEGTLQVASLKLKNIKLANVRLKLDGTPGGTQQQQLSAALYGGNADLDLRVAPGAKQALKLTLNAVSVGPLLKDFIDSDKLSGKGSFTLDVTSAGRTVGAVRKALNGSVKFSLSNGAVKGFNLGKIMRDGQALFLANAAPSSGGLSTDFAELSGSGSISNGVLKSDDLSAKNPLLRLIGAGEINLVGETINYVAKPTLVNTASGQGGKELAGLSGITVPIRLSGNLFQPKVSIDWQSALKQEAVTQLREKLGVSEETVREQREELRSRAKEELSKGLLKLFGGSTKPAAPEAAPDAESPPPTP